MTAMLQVVFMAIGLAVLTFVLAFLLLSAKLSWGSTPKVCTFSNRGCEVPPVNTTHPNVMTLKGSTNLVFGHSFRVHSLVRGCGPGVLRTPGY